MDNREEIREHIALSAALSRRLLPPEPLYAGWVHLFQCGIDPVNVRVGQQVPPDALGGLLRDASSDPDAYDACSTLAGLQLRAGVDFDPSLREFVFNSLLGKTIRPKRGKRSIGKGVRDNITRYIVLRQALHFFPMQKGKGPRTENEIKAKSQYKPDAFSVVSEALTDGGLHTTPDQLKNLLYHPSNEAIRQFGDWAMNND